MYNKKGNMYSTEIRESPRGKYLKVFMLDDSMAEKLQKLLNTLKEVKNVNITESQSNAHPGNTLTIYPKPKVNIETLDKIVKSTLDKYYSGVTEVKTEIISQVDFQNIEQKILDALDEAQATIDVCVAWFTNTTLQKSYLKNLKKDVRYVL